MKSDTRLGRSPKVATIADVARHAGVSPMTVSRVVNGELNVRLETRQKVQAALAALNYVPNQAARNLAGSDLIRIGVIYNDPSASYLNKFLIGLLNKSSLSNVRLVVQRCDVRAQEATMVAEMLQNGLDGLILPPPFCDSQALLKLVAETDTPAVTVSSGLPGAQVCAVGIDDYRAAYVMTRHLLQLGHQRLGFIVGDPKQTSSDRRLAGFHAAMADAGLGASNELVAQGLFSYRSGLDAAEVLLSDEQRPTAIFASNDDMAAATVAIAHRMGLDVPSDLTVVGFDDAPLATTIWPELTTVRQPIAEMAAAAVDLVVRQVRSRRNGESIAPEQMLMDFELVRRQSDAAPRFRPPLRVTASRPSEV
ncbi:LacI family DNA-binding transcriptional regulator [Aquabacterium sp. OR-4]|uniref:LacI family DNA-binding transcriptional regulator n=1 Tax=Aquabacterium sp. OR-4 TaxID=2978127 RepID=UPI0028CA199B|nr:LacI family DNA-binding transcriptional regulator [Aquabacterium sp. OR-4]MDT7838608.1 LacI family DNA-binding transcriptional regulator [Aquabacterium sp. OR-4]